MSADFFSECVAETLGIPVDSVTIRQRELAKQMTFVARMGTPFQSRTDKELRQNVLSVLEGMRHELSSAGPKCLRVPE